MMVAEKEHEMFREIKEQHGPGIYKAVGGGNSNTTARRRQVNRQNDKDEGNYTHPLVVKNSKSPLETIENKTITF